MLPFFLTSTKVCLCHSGDPAVRLAPQHVWAAQGRTRWVPAEWSTSEPSLTITIRPLSAVERVAALTQGEDTALCRAAWVDCSHPDVTGPDVLPGAVVMQLAEAVLEVCGIAPFAPPSSPTDSPATPPAG